LMIKDLPGEETILVTRHKGCFLRFINDLTASGS